MTRPVLLLLLVILLAGAVSSDRANAAAQRPRRIISLNLCTDQLVLALADRGQIVGLTRLAADPQMSAAASQAVGLPLFKGSVEDVLIARPDLVIGMPARHSAFTALLAPGSYRAVDLQPANSLDEIFGSIQTVAHAVGHPQRGMALIARMKAALTRLPRARGRPVAAYYQRRGYLTGSGTLVDELMTRAGLVNLATRLGKPPLSQVSLEEMVAARPDILIVESATDRVRDQGSEMLHHPALSGAASPGPGLSGPGLSGMTRVSIPQAWTVCGGPAYVAAARALSGAVAKR